MFAWSARSSPVTRSLATQSQPERLKR